MLIMLHHCKFENPVKRSDQKQQKPERTVHSTNFLTIIIVSVASTPAIALSTQPGTAFSEDLWTAGVAPNAAAARIGCCGDKAGYLVGEDE